VVAGNDSPLVLLVSRDLTKALAGVDAEMLDGMAERWSGLRAEEGGTHSYRRANVLLGVLLVERLVTPPPPGHVAIDVEKELRNLLALRVPKRHGVSNCLVRALPGLAILIDTIEQPQFLGEERPELREPLPRVDTSVQPREVATGHHEISKYPAVVAAVQRPSAAVMIAHDDDISDCRGFPADPYPATASPLLVPRPWSDARFCR